MELVGSFQYLFLDYCSDNVLLTCQIHGLDRHKLQVRVRLQTQRGVLVHGRLRLDHGSLVRDLWAYSQWRYTGVYVCTYVCICVCIRVWMCMYVCCEVQAFVSFAFVLISCDVGHMTSRQVLFEGVPTHPTVSRCWEIIDKYNVTHFYTAPTAIRSLMGHGDEPVSDMHTMTVTVIILNRSRSLTSPHSRRCKATA